MNKNNNNNKILLIQSLDLETAQKVSTCPGKTQPGENSIFILACCLLVGLNEALGTEIILPQLIASNRIIFGKLWVTLRWLLDIFGMIISKSKETKFLFSYQKFDKTSNLVSLHQALNCYVRT